MKESYLVSLRVMTDDSCGDAARYVFLVTGAQRHLLHVCNTPVHLYNAGSVAPLYVDIYKLIHQDKMGFFEEYMFRTPWEGEIELMKAGKRDRTLMK